MLRLTGYWFLRTLSRLQLEELTEPADGPSTQALLSLASEFGMTPEMTW